MDNKAVRCAIYARVSTADQHCSQQLQELRSYVAARGWTLTGEYVDKAVSGTKASRPQLNSLMEAAGRRAVDAIAVVKIDRWGRSMPHFVESVQTLTRLGVRFVATSQGIDTDQSNPTGRLMLNLLASFAEFERDLIVERTRAGLARARLEGKKLGRPLLIRNRPEVIAALAKPGATLRSVAERYSLSAATVMRIRNAPRDVR